MKKLFKILIFFLLVIVVLYNVAKYIYKDDYINIIEKECDIYNVDKYEILAIIKAESNFDPDAVSARNAIGLMQLTLDTANWCAEKLNISKVTESDLHNPELNIKLGIYYYDYLFERYGDLDTTLAAYNAGMGKVDVWLDDEIYSSDGKKISKTPYEETNKYIIKINNNLKIYKTLYKEWYYEIRTNKCMGNHKWKWKK